jgi:hypothetical protein
MKKSRNLNHVPVLPSSFCLAIMLLHHLIRFIALMLIVIGAVGFSLPFWINNVIKNDPAIEMPLSMISDAAVSPDGRVFVGIAPLGRVQIYSANGNFLRSFSVDFPSGTVCLDAMDAPPMPVEDSRVQTAELIIEGLRVREYWPSRRFSCRLDASVKSVTWWPTSVIVSFTEGRPPLALARAWWHYFALGPFVSFLTLAIGMLLRNGAAGID